MEQTGNLKEAVYKAILEDIFNHVYKSNQILSEKELTQKYGCSKSPVRDALITLCNENVLRSIPRCGYEVVRMTRDDVKEMLQFRYFIESGAIRKCCRSIAPQQIQALKNINEKCTGDGNDVWEHWEQNINFHLKLIGFLGNEYLIIQLQKCMNQLKRAYAQFYWDKWSEQEIFFDTRSHKEMIECLENQNLEGILESLRKDLNDFAGMDMSTEFTDE